MGFRRHRETDLERELRAQRPQPRAQFVQMIAGRNVEPTTHRGVASGRRVSRIALVAVVTVVLAASLGVTGALGHASTSIKSLGTSVYHIVHSHTGRFQGGDPNDDHDHDGRIPFHHEYHHVLPICHDGQVQYVSVVLYLPLLFTPHHHYWIPLSFNPPRCK
jgi:hypothetical protein